MFLVQTRGYAGPHANGLQAFSTLKAAVEYTICVYVGVYTAKNIRYGKYNNPWNLNLDSTARFANWCRDNFKITEVPVDDVLLKSKVVNLSKVLDVIEEHGMKV